MMGNNFKISESKSVVSMVAVLIRLFEGVRVAHGVNQELAYHLLSRKDLQFDRQVIWR